MKLWHFVLASILVLAAADPAFACAVCFDANDESRGAFLGTTIFLSLFPLGMVGGIIFWLWRRSRELDESHPTPS